MCGAAAIYFPLVNPNRPSTLLEKGLEVSSTAATDHMYSQLLQWKAFGLSLTGDVDAADKTISKATRLRENAGGPFFTGFHNILAGAVYTRIKNYEQARICLEKGLAISQTISSTYLTICALFNLSHYKYESESPEAALDNLETGLSLMKINGYNHFWSWEPEMMTKLLSVAVRRDIEKSFSQSLAKTRLSLNFSDDGEPFPLLKFRLMDSFELSISGKVILQSKDFTPLQRELLGLLITSKGQRIPQERIQLEFWPESAPDSARKSFDTLLSRLRRLIAPHLPMPVKNYLYIQKGILCLTNYEIDALQLVEAARTGISHCKNSDFWKAHNAFQTAISLWKGTMPEDTFRSEQVLTFNDILADLMAEMGSIWAQNLAEAGKTEEAIAILERILLINYLDEELTILLYKFHCRNNNHLKAREVLERYRKALLIAEYTPEEANSFIDQVIATI